MRFHTLIALSAGLLSSENALPTDLGIGLLTRSDAAAAPTELEILARAFPNAPDGYAPANTTCPANRPTIRGAAQLSPNESSWLPERRNNTVQAMKDFFGHVNISGFDAAGYIDRVSSNATNLPNIGIAISGGGYRALLNGAGVIKAFDSRTDNTTSPGQLGGLLQSATYLAGLSGGSWLVASIYINNFTTISALQDDGAGEAWQFDRSIFEGPSQGHSINLLNTADYFKTVYDQVIAKQDAGYNLTITDIW
jgi:lysophospholipase